MGQGLGGPGSVLWSRLHRIKLPKIHVKPNFQLPKTRGTPNQASPRNSVDDSP